MDDYRIIWAILLFAAALVLLFLELFVPSGGLIGVLAGAAAFGGVIMLFAIDTDFGLIGAIVVGAAIPFCIYLGIKMFPHTFVARWLTLKNPAPLPVDEDGDGEPDPAPRPSARPEDLPAVGATGQAVGDLRPVGACLIDGKRIECLADESTIDAGSAIKVVAVDGMHVKVRTEREV